MTGPSEAARQRWKAAQAGGVTQERARRRIRVMAEGEVPSWNCLPSVWNSPIVKSSNSVFPFQQTLPTLASHLLFILLFDEKYMEISVYAQCCAKH